MLFSLLNYDDNKTIERALDKTLSTEHMQVMYAEPEILRELFISLASDLSI